MKSIKKSLLLSLAILFFINVFAQNYSQNKPEKNHQLAVQNEYLVPLNLTITTSDGNPILFAVVTLEGPATYIDTIAENDPFEIEYVLEGIYDLTIKPVKYYIYSIQDIVVDGTQILNVVLIEKGYPPRNLYIDQLTSIATWDPPQITALLEDFNSPLFPPEGWTMESEGAGWFKTDSLSFPNFQIPPHNSQFACVIDYQDTVNNNGCCDYLITPPLDLRESDGYSLKFDSYYNGANGQSAYIEYSLDTCATWELLYTLLPLSQWQYVEVDLSAISGFPGPDAIWLAFHADDNGLQASGWAIDNVDVSVNNNSDWPPTSGYYVFVDGAYVAYTEETTYHFYFLTYGIECEVCVAVNYSSGFLQICNSFISEYLIPPCNLQGMSPTGTDYVYLIWETPLEPFDYVVISEKPGTYQPDKNVEYSPTVKEIEGKGHGRDQWDVQFNFPIGGVGSEVGIESDGNYIYTSQRDAGNGTFYKYGLDGTFLGPFVIPDCQNLCDLAYDGAHFFGSNATTSVWEMDFETQTVVSTIFAPTDCRAIAYDEQFDGFWCNNWTTDIVLFDKNGTQFNSFPVGAYANFHGFAYDGWSPGGPFLWGFSRDGSGAEIVQMDIATGTQIFNFNVLPLVGGSGVAGGLFSHCELIEPNLATLGGLLLSELIFGLELAECEGGGGIIPENLLGFNIYRNGEYQDYIESIPDSFSYEWYDLDMEHGIYEYVVTAVYDITPYGFPGDTAESMEEGPVTVIFIFPIILPFYEDWSSGNFDFNDWIAECDNWQVNIQTGNPLPSAEFQGDTALTNYNCGLVSGTFLGQDIIDGEIFLDFDIMLDSWVDTAIQEKMIVKVWENDIWHTIIEFINEGDMDWTSNHINISEFAKGNYFRIGFFATGLNSADILAWYIDNIHMYRVCLPPYNMLVEIEEFVTVAYVYIDWTAPYSNYGEWLSYNDGTFENALSSTEGGAGLAQVFTPPQYPCTITEVRFFVSGNLNYYQDEEVYVLTGDGATILAGPYIIPGVADDWVTIDVDDVTITEGTFMVATFNILPDGPFIGMDYDNYDATLYFGSIGDFTELGEYGYFCIGSHEAYVEYETSDNVVVNSVLSKPKSNYKRSDIVMSNTFSDGTKKPDRDLLGYNIFRSDDGGDFEQINEELVLENTYTDTLYTGGWYCYYATAIYSQCESCPSDTACTPCYVGIEEVSIESTISVYPNPAKDFINIISKENINKITVINFAGQKVFEKKVADETNIMLNTASYETGVYIIKIETENRITAKRITITR